MAFCQYSEIANHHEEGHLTGPTENWHLQLERLNAQLERNKKEATRTRRGAYLATLNREKASKTFYHHYKTPRTATRIPAIHVTPDWDNPEEKLYTSEAPEVILAEFTKYYGWLFGPKPSKNSKKFLDLYYALHKYQNT